MLAGIDASDGIFDGVTLLRVVLDSLQIVLTDDVAALHSKLNVFRVRSQMLCL